MRSMAKMKLLKMEMKSSRKKSYQKLLRKRQGRKAKRKKP